ncbi:3-dehydroquinate synthase [Haematospirillum jordaniae]|uniref:3-dehydroquinate synthase n=1 Tax=Haematospirillum jordaniae TaxID=1549855 RepID=A0A143DBJ6_9PROT|nr:3-dehydroquinate synthase [Haematospirillum jordaniae]AMW34082.1 3-dehydroquinate synthase [Haematospirillum jordaniae]NKD45278.1 3-dehydroquinate synthase [Haematospirillum jordaniae]NKD57270.1 3-dehydroquinate synthase [Haematospirillum jordaniae]NKD59624.1 3-dehydroquinate synthase [Haematospirillum jordaniae]NKD67196.1 3-dehydroquinate synthase [Haematospirillum jordaniae]
MMPAPEMYRHLTVDLGPRSYDILIGHGLLAQAGRLTAEITKGRHAFIVTDQNVAPLYLDTLQHSLAESGFRTGQAILHPGEHSKTFQTLQALQEQMLANHCERSSLVIALGGGVVGDIAGFAAATLLRGIDFVQIPTTLLAQVDSSVGGKTGINTAHGKNLVGAFHQPLRVITDTDTLSTLPARERLAGYAEVAKYGLIDDATFWHWLEDNGPAVLSLDTAALAQAIHTSCVAKARLVGADERESGVRALLNLGHTFGHALERAYNYDGTLLHGEAVAIGMIMAFDLSARMGLCQPTDTDRIRHHFQTLGLPVAPPLHKECPLDADRLVEYMASDKKAKDGTVTFVLSRGIGQAFLCRDVVPADVSGILQQALTSARSTITGP